jgi:hypothetical protein
MSQINLSNVFPLLAIQIVFLGWRINREIPLGDNGRRVWFPIYDIINLLAMILIVMIYIILPNIITVNDKILKRSFSCGFVLLVFHPINAIMHYGLFNKSGKRNINQNSDYSYCPLAEAISTIIGIIITSFVFLV